MKNLIVNKLSHRTKVLTQSTFNKGSRASLKSTEAILAGYDELDATPKIFSINELFSTDQLKTIEVILSVEKIEPNSNFLNIWIGNQLLSGTMVNEAEQTITGFVKRSPSPQDGIFLEYPDGHKKEFEIPIVEL